MTITCLLEVEPSGGSRGRVRGVLTSLFRTEFFCFFLFKWFETEILTTEGSHMTIKWLFLKKKLVLHFIAQLNTRLVRICIFFFDYLLMVGSTRTEQCPALQKHLVFQPITIKRSKKLKLWNVMHNDAKLTWAEVISRKTVSTYGVKFGPPPPLSKIPGSAPGALSV